MYRKKGFTLIELLVVILIVGILAAVAIPFLRGNTTRAIATEAITALGTIKSAERMQLVESGSYLQTFGGPISALPGINPGDLDGHYFSEDCYLVFVGGSAITILCCMLQGLNMTNDAPGAADVTRAFGAQFWITMDQNGNIASNVPGIP